MYYHLSRYTNIFQRYGRWWLFHSPTGIAAELTEDFVETEAFQKLVSDSVVRESKNSVLKFMIEKGILLDEEKFTNEPSLLDKQLQQYINDEKSFELTILPTEKCNFRCAYCYEDFSLGRMSKELIESIKKLITEKASNGKVRRLKISWFGGEPLVAKDIVFEISSHALHESRRNNIMFASDITTNGYYLTKDNLDSLLKYQIRGYQITLDGPPVTHNKSRVLFNGRGTFERIWANLLSMQQRSDEFSVLLRMNINDLNYEETEAWLPELSQTFLRTDGRFFLHFHPVFDKDLQGKRKDGSSQLSRIQALYKLARTLNLPTDFENQLRPFGSICYAAKRNNLVIRSNGVINKCTVAFGVPENDVGVLTEDGNLELNDHFDLWVRDKLDNDYCRNCTVAYQCGGHASCPLKAITGDETKRYCASVKQTETWVPMLA